MKKILFIAMLLISVIIVGNNSSVNAATESMSSLQSMGSYEQTETVMKSVCIYIQEEMVYFVKSTGAKVYSKETKHMLFGRNMYSTYKYWFYEDQFVTEIVEQRQLYNDIDSFIYMVNELEAMAIDFNPNSSSANFVLAYIKAVNKNFYCSTLDVLNSYVGPVDYRFNTYVQEHEGNGIKFAEYFAQFLQKADDYNKVYGDIDDKYKEKHLMLIDPFNSNSYIDVVRLCASMDSLFNQTGNILVIELDFQRELFAWLGDLHKFTYAIDNSGKEIEDMPTYYTGYYSGYVNNTIDLEQFTGVTNASMSEPFLIADVDAYNMTRTFLDDNINTLGHALSGYYNMIRDDNNYYPNRYKMYIETMGTNSANPDNLSSGEAFRRKVYRYMNLQVDDNGVISNFRFNDPYLFVGFGMLRGSWGPKFGTFPSVKVRAYAAKLYTDYLIEMSTRAYYYHF